MPFSFFPFHSRFTGAQSVENEGHLVKFLLQHFRMLQDAARVLPTPSQHLQHDPTMLQDVSLKCCLRLAGPLQCYQTLLWFTQTSLVKQKAG